MGGIDFVEDLGVCRYRGRRQKKGSRHGGELVSGLRAGRRGNSESGKPSIRGFDERELLTVGGYGMRKGRRELSERKESEAARTRQ